MENEIKDIIEQYEIFFYDDSSYSAEACITKFPDVFEIAKRCFNLGVKMAAENAEVIWVSNPKLDDSNHETAIVEKESILKLLLK
jgi:hypothetical protein